MSYSDLLNEHRVSRSFSTLVSITLLQELFILSIPVFSCKWPSLRSIIQSGGLEVKNAGTPINLFRYRYGIPCGCQVSLQKLGLKAESFQIGMHDLFSLSLCLVWRCATRVRRMASQFPRRVPLSLSITSVFPCLAPLPQSGGYDGRTTRYGRRGAACPWRRSNLDRNMGGIR